MLLAEMARPERAGAKAPTAWVERHGSRRSDEQSWRVESGRPTRAASSFKQLGPATIRLSRSIGSCKPVRLPGSTAGCGKPHVRWCGRVAGRNPRHSTRSRLAAPRPSAYSLLRLPRTTSTATASFVPRRFGSRRALRAAHAYSAPLLGARHASHRGRASPARRVEKQTMQSWYWAGEY